MCLKNCILLFVIFTVSKCSIPSYIHVCKRTDPNLNQCVKNSAEALREKLKGGIAELNVPAVEPLRLNLVQLRSGPKQAKINADIANVDIYGITAFEMDEVNVDVDKIQFLIKAKVPGLHFTGDYDFDISLLILNYQGKGKLAGNFSETHVTAHFKGHLEKINGKDCAQFEKLQIELRIGKSIMQLDDAGFKDKTLGMGINAVLEENSDLFFNEIQPLLEDMIEEKFTAIANGITAAFSYEELFPK